MFSTKKQQAQARDDHQQPEFKVLTAVKELVPRPDTLSHWHRNEFDCYDEEENAAETHNRSRTIEECGETGADDAGKRNHLSVGRE